jgi:exodeoxyribonuclease-5
VVTLSPTQDAVVRAVEAWLRDPHGPQWKYLAGFAGTGKTTLAKKLAECWRVAYCAFTGKAANVLRQKGCEGATTLHPPDLPPRREGRADAGRRPGVVDRVHRA